MAQYIKFCRVPYLLQSVNAPFPPMYHLQGGIGSNALVFLEMYVIVLKTSCTYVWRNKDAVSVSVWNSPWPAYVFNIEDQNDYYENGKSKCWKVNSVNATLGSLVEPQEGYCSIDGRILSGLVFHISLLKWWKKPSRAFWKVEQFFKA